MKPPERRPYLKIGDVARLVGVSPSVIRSWESLGLTRPRRTASKYRLYAPEDVKLLKRARFLRRVRGLNAPAIVQLLKRDGQVRVELTLHAAVDSTIPFQHGLPAEVDVEVEQTSPMNLVLRSAGLGLRSRPTPVALSIR